MKRLLEYIAHRIQSRVGVLLVYTLGGLGVGLAGYIALLLTGGGSLLLCVCVGLGGGLLTGIWALVEDT